MKVTGSSFSCFLDDLLSFVVTFGSLAVRRTYLFRLTPHLLQTWTLLTCADWSPHCDITIQVASIRGAQLSFAARCFVKSLQSRPLLIWRRKQYELLQNKSSGGFSSAFLPMSRSKGCLHLMFQRTSWPFCVLTTWWCVQEAEGSTLKWPQVRCLHHRWRWPVCHSPTCPPALRWWWFFQLQTEQKQWDYSEIYEAGFHRTATSLEIKRFCSDRASGHRSKFRRWSQNTRRKTQK